MLRRRFATGPLLLRGRSSTFAFGVSSRVLVHLIQSGAPFFLKCGAPKAFGAYNRLLRSTNHFPVPAYLPPSPVFAAFRHYEGEVVSNNIVAKACNKLTTCLLNIFSVLGYLPPSLAFAAFRHFEGEVVSNNIVAKARNKLIVCLLNTFSRSRLLTTLPGFCSFSPF